MNSAQDHTSASTVGSVFALAAIVLVVGVTLVPVLGVSLGGVNRSTCFGNVRQLALANLVYASDYDDRLPPAGSWVDRVVSYAPGASYGVFHCPFVRPGSPDYYGYAFKQALSEKPVPGIKAPDATPLVFDSLLLVRNATTNDLPPFPFGRQPNPAVAYADGHVRTRRRT